MADLKISQLPVFTSAVPAVDAFAVVSGGTTKQITTNQILGSGGTATLASATITGDLTVDTNVLKVDTTLNRVGILQATPATALDVNGDITQRNGSGTIIGNIQNSAGLYDVKASANVTGLQLSTAAATPIVFALNNATAMTLNSTGLGVGVVPSSFGRFSVQGTAGGAGILGVDTDATRVDIQSYNKPLALNRSGNNITMCEGGGNVGIGVTPSAWGGAYTALQNRQTSWFSTSSRDLNLGANVYVDASNNYKYIAAFQASLYALYLGEHTWYTAAAGAAANDTITAFASAKMTLDVNGNLVIGNALASGVGTTGGLVSNPNSGASYHLIGHTTGTTSGSNFTYYFYAGSQIGSITQNGTTGVLFNITSDYRLKESVKPISGGLARVNALKPSVYNWKSDGSTGEGFLAHELAEVVPFAVTGEKDAVDKDGKIKPQGIDMSRVVPILVAAIQELTAEVNALKNA